MKQSRCILVLLLLGFAGTVLLGCSSGEKGQPRPSSSATPVASVSPGFASSLTFKAPSEWIEESPESRMRLAQYRLPHAEGDPEDAELVVFYFQGQGGSVEANVERWVGQFKKPDGSTASDLAKIIDKESNGVSLTIVDVSGTYAPRRGPMMAAEEPKPDFRMLAAIAETAAGPWFFKLTGPQNTVAKWEESFFSFLNTIELAS